METVDATLTWFGDDDAAIYVEPMARLWDVEGAPRSDLIAVFHEVDENEDRTGRIAGVEVVGLLDLEDWSKVPALPFLWRLPGMEPLPLVDLLKMLKAQAKRESVAKAS